MSAEQKAMTTVLNYCAVSVHEPTIDLTKFIGLHHSTETMFLAFQYLRKTDLNTI